MESATDPDVVDAVRVQNVSYLHLSMLALLIHDWLILFEREVEYVWGSSWGITKILFIITRYGPFFDMPITITTHIIPYDLIGDGTCTTLYKIATWNTFLGISISESILLLRTNAVYSGSKSVIIPLSIAYFLAAVAGIIITWLYLRAAIFGPPPSYLTNGCFLVQRDAIIFFNFLMLLAFELAVVILTVKRGFRDFYLGTPLLRVVYRDSVASFLALFALTLSMILVLALGPPQYGGLMAASTRVLHSIVCCRILLNLRRAAAWGSHSTEASTALAFATAPGQQTNQAEVTRFGAYGTRSDEEDTRWEAGGIPLGDVRRSLEEAE